MKAKLKILTIGGGTGSFTLLSKLRELKNVELTSVVAMSDSGGSTGRLRVEMGVLPAGDVRQALVALSRSPELTRELFTYRYSTGDIAGHSFGNLFISTLEKISGSMEEAIRHAGKLLQVRGRIYPITLQKHDLVVVMPNGEKIIGEGNVDNRFVTGYTRIYLTDAPSINPKVKKAVQDADLIIVAPGNFYCSIVPNFLVSGLTKALEATNAKKVFIANLLTKEGHTTGKTVADFVEELHELSGGFLPDQVIYNTNDNLSDTIQEILKNEGSELVKPGSLKNTLLKDVKFVGIDAISEVISKQNTADTVKRSLLRHNMKNVIEALGLR